MNIRTLKINSIIFIFFIIVLISCAPEDEVKKDVVAQVNLSQVTDTELESIIPPTTPAEVKVALKRKLMEKWIELGIEHSKLTINLAKRKRKK